MRLQVLYLTEPIDEPAVNAIGEFEEFKFVDVTREGLDLGDVAEEDKKKVGVPLQHACYIELAQRTVIMCGLIRISNCPLHTIPFLCSPALD